MRVKATQAGYYASLLRAPGDEFTLAAEGDFSDLWMVNLEPEAPAEGDPAPAAPQRRTRNT